MKIFNTLADLQAASLLANEQVVSTKGKLSVDDGLGQVFIITSNVTGIPLANAGVYAQPIRTSGLAGNDDGNFSSQDGMFTWWMGPKTLRHKADGLNQTYQTFCDEQGHAGIVIHNHYTDTTKRYVLNRDLVKDDHNSGAVCVGEGKVAMVVGGRSNTTEPVDNVFYAEWDIDDEPFGNSYVSYYIPAAGRDYPNLYYFENDAILLTSLRGGPDGSGGEFTTGHAFTLNSWPAVQGNWTSRVNITDPANVPDWMYLTTRRDKDNPSIIHMAWGFHPTFVNVADIYKSELRHVGGANPWRLYANGVEIANLSTGAGLPIDLSDLELAYTAPVNERTRLYDVKDNQMVFTRYTDTGNTIADKSAAEYVYLKKNGATWTANNIVASGLGFLPGVSTYYSGVAISENDDYLLLGRRDANGLYLFGKYTSNDNGVTWSEQENYRLSTGTDAATNAVHGRVEAEVPSLETIQGTEPVHFQTVGWIGYYDELSFTRYNTALVSLDPWDSTFTLSPTQYRSLAIASKNCDSHNNNTFVAASDNCDITSTNSPTGRGDGLQAAMSSENCVIEGRERQQIDASSGSTIKSRNTFFGGTRNSVADGVVAPAGGVDQWMMTALGTDTCTVAKTNSAVIGAVNCQTGIGSNENIKCNFIASSENSSSDADSSFVSILSSVGGTVDGEGTALIGTTDCTIDLFSGNQWSTILAAFNSGTTRPRTVVIGSRDSNADGTQSSIISSEYSQTTGEGCSVIASVGVLNAVNYAIAGGVGTTTPLTGARKWQIESATGDIKIEGTLSQGFLFSDTAKMVENGEGKEIEAGYLLTLIGNKVYKAKAGESVDAIVAATPSSIHNDTPFSWKGKYVRDDFGRRIMEPVQFVKYEGFDGPYTDGMELPDGVEPTVKLIPNPEDDTQNLEINWVSWADTNVPLSQVQNVPSFAEVVSVDLPKENPDYNPEQVNVKRSDRPDEWTIAGVHGMIRTRVNQTVTKQALEQATASRKKTYLTVSEVDGIGELSAKETNVIIMDVEKEYDPSKGYGVALCFLG